MSRGKSRCWGGGLHERGVVIRLGHGVVLQSSGEEQSGAERGLLGQGGSAGSCHPRCKNEAWKEDAPRRRATEGRGQRSGREELAREREQAAALFALASFTAVIRHLLTAHGPKDAWFGC